MTADRAPNYLCVYIIVYVTSRGFSIQGETLFCLTGFKLAWAHWGRFFTFLQGSVTCLVTCGRPRVSCPFTDRVFVCSFAASLKVCAPPVIADAADPKHATARSPWL